MSNQGNFIAVAIAGIGMIGTVAAGALGYQSGSKAVDKDYVQIATQILSNKDAIPELRKWSVEVLNKLSPTPFGSDLKEKLSSGGFYSPAPFIPRINLPEILSEPCPDILRRKDSYNSDEITRIVTEYETCRIKMEGFIDYINKINNSNKTYNDELKKTRNNFNKNLDPLL